MKISIKWLLVTGFVGLPLLTVGIIQASFYISSQKALLRHAKEIMEKIAVYTIHETQGHLHPAQDAARLTRRLSEGALMKVGDVVGLERYFLEQLALHPQFNGLYYGNAIGEFHYVSRSDDKAPGGFRTKIISMKERGRTTEIFWRDRFRNLIGGESAPHDVYDPRKRPWYKAAEKAGGLTWTEPYIFFTSRKPGVTTACPVMDSLGVPRGVVGVDIEIEAISTFLSGLKIGKNGLSFILNKNGEVVAFPDAAKMKRVVQKEGETSLRLIRIDELEDVLPRKAFESLERPIEYVHFDRPVFTMFTHENRRYHAMFAPFEDPGLPWVVGVYLPEDDYLGPIKENRRFNIRFALCIAIAAGLIGLIIARNIAKPMSALRLEAEAVKEWKLNETFDKSGVIKEIQDTADAFTRMKAGLVVFKSENRVLTRGLEKQAAELRSKEVHLKATLTNLINYSDALIILDESGVVQFVNPAAETLLRTTSREILGRKFEYPVIMGPSTEMIIKPEGTKRTRMKETMEVAVESLTDQPSIVEKRVFFSEWKGRSALLVSLRDITERKRMEKEIRWRAETLEALHDTALDLAAREALPELFRAIAERAVNLLGAGGAVIFRHDPREDVLEDVLEYQMNERFVGITLKPGEGLAGKVLASGSPMLVEDYQCWPGRSALFEGDEARACVAVPIRWGDRILGVLILVKNVPDSFTMDDIELLERFSPLAAAALEQRRMLQQARRDAETKSLLLKEVNHRVKNNLSAIIGLLYAEKRCNLLKNNPRFKEFMDMLIIRMRGLSAVHELLSASEWKPLLLRELAERIIHAALQAFPGNKAAKVTLSPSRIRVPSVQANSLAMVINEISTNTAKYGLSGGSAGNIAVEISREEATIVFRFRDDGPGYPADVLKEERSNVGLYLMRTLVERDLRGALTLGNDNGAVTTVRFKANDPAL